MRLIDADAVVFHYDGLNYIPYDDFRSTAKYFMDQIKEMPTITPEPHWIPVTICPNEDDDYICTLEDSNGNFTDIVSYDSVQGWGFYPDDGDEFLPIANVIAWMPLPEPFKGVTDGRF